MVPAGLRSLKGLRIGCSLCAQRSILQPAVQPWRLAQRRWKSDDKPSDGQDEPIVWDSQKAQTEGTDAPMDVPFRKKQVPVEQAQKTTPNHTEAQPAQRPPGSSSWTPEIPAYLQMKNKITYDKDTLFVTTPIFYVNACECNVQVNEKSTQD